MKTAFAIARFVGLAFAGALVLVAASAGAEQTFPATGYVLFLGAVAAVECLAAVRRSLPAEERPFRPLVTRRGGAHQTRNRPVSLLELETAVAAGQTQERALKVRLAPRYRELARQRLARRGIDLDGEPDRARAALGEAGWALAGPTPHLTDVDAAVAALESL